MATTTRRRNLVRTYSSASCSSLACGCLFLLLLLLPVAPADADSVDDRVEQLNELLKDFSTVVAERRGDEVVVTGWARSSDDKKTIGKIISSDKQAVDLVGDDVADGGSMVEIDVAIIVVKDTVSKSVGFDFLNLVTLQFERFTTSHEGMDGYGIRNPASAAGDHKPMAFGDVDVGTRMGHLFDARVDYSVNIANASDDFVHIVARPHLATLNGEKAEFHAGGEIVFKVTGINSGGRIQPYPYGINIKVTPTVLRSPGPKGEKQVLLDVEASRLSVLEFQFASEGGLENVDFDKVEVKSKALLPMNETLILSGLYQSETRNLRAGVPILRSIPFIKYFFSNTSNVTEVLSMVVLLTPREPGVLTKENQEHLDWFIQRRSTYLRAKEAGGAEIQQFMQQYGNWYKPQWNRYASHFFLVNNSALYGELRGEDLRTDKIRRDIMSVQTAKEVAKSIDRNRRSAGRKK